MQEFSVNFKQKTKTLTLNWNHLLTLQYLSYVTELREGFILELSNLGFWKL